MPALPPEFTNNPEVGFVPPRSQEVPLTSKSAEGAVVPIPTLPELRVKVLSLLKVPKPKFQTLLK